MSDTKTLNLYLLVDRTGSMASNWQSTINTINEYMNGLKEIDLNINLAFFDKTTNPYIPTTILSPNTLGNYTNFDMRKEPILQPKYINTKQWVPLSANDISIQPRGMTPLYDAICEYADIIKTAHKKKELVQFVIITDGDENVSTKYSLSDAKTTLNKFEKKGWPVLYLGANLEAFSGGSKIVSDFGKLSQYNPTKWSDTALSLNSATMRYATTHDVGSAAFTDEERKSMS